jgi:hypothetical protein
MFHFAVLIIRQIDFIQEIAEVYYETRQSRMKRLYLFSHWVKGAASEEIRLQKKVYFRNQEALIEKTDRKYTAHFAQTALMQDLILDSEGKKGIWEQSPNCCKPNLN